MKIKTTSRVYKIAVIFFMLMSLASAFFAIVCIRDYAITLSTKSAKLAAMFSGFSFVYYFLLQRYGLNSYSKRSKAESLAQKAQKKSSSTL